MRMVNASSTVVNLPEFGLELQPGAECDIPDTYAKPRLQANGARRPSIIEMIAPQLFPADPQVRAKWSEAPSFEEKAEELPVSRVEQLQNKGMSQGMAEMRAAFEAQPKPEPTETKRGRKPKAQS